MLKYILYGTGLMLIGILAGYYIGRGQKAETLVVHDVQTVTRVVNHIVTVTRTVKPDGTVIETTKTEDKQNDKTTDEAISSSTSTPVGSNYSLGVRYHVSPLAIGDVLTSPYKGIEVTAGRRILGDLWLDLGVQPINRDISLGVRIDL